MRTTKPNDRPASSEGARFVSEPAPPPARPVKICVGSPVAVDGIVELAVEFGLEGLRAPHGWFCRQSLEHGGLPIPQALTHWLPHSWQVKKGRVREYSDTFGWSPLPQTHPYVKVSGSHVFVKVVYGGVCWQMIGQVLLSFLHHDSRVDRDTEPGLI